MSASRMPVFSPSAAKPRARLQEVVDLPTPPLPEATAMTCLTPGRPAAFDVARAQIIFRRHDGRALRPGMRIETLIYYGFDAAIRAHLDDVEAFGVGALEHPVFFAEFCKHAVDRAFGAEGFAAGDAVERIFLLQHTQRRAPGLEVETRFEGDDLLGAGRFAEAALHAEAFGEA